MRDRRRHYLPAPPDLLDEDFDEGEDEALAVLEHEVSTLGCVPLHPDEDRITTYDPVPLQADDERYRQPVPLPIREDIGPWRAPQPGGPGTIRYPPPPVPLYSDVIAWLVDKLPPPAARIPIVSPIPGLPPEFRWLVGEDQWLTQDEVVAFWVARQKRETWQHWAYSPIDRNPKHGRT
jgi:hypothetical protein